MRDQARPVEPECLWLEDEGAVPNHPELPVLLYRQVLDPLRGDCAAAFARLFRHHGWGGVWHDGIFSFLHYHSTAHEVLGIARGRARLALGGPRGVLVEVAAGDALVLPAGTGHRRIDASPDLHVVGAYPPGQSWDLLRGRPGERMRALANIARVPLPQTDPLFGKSGPLPRLWARSGKGESAG